MTDHIQWLWKKPKWKKSTNSTLTEQVEMDRYLVDCIRHVLGFDPLYEDLTPEQRHEQRKAYLVIHRKPYADLTLEQKARRSEDRKRWRQRQKDMGKDYT